MEKQGSRKTEKRLQNITDVYTKRHITVHWTHFTTLKSHIWNPYNLSYSLISKSYHSEAYTKRKQWQLPIVTADLSEAIAV